MQKNKITIKLIGDITSINYKINSSVKHKISFKLTQDEIKEIEKELLEEFERFLFLSDVFEQKMSVLNFSKKD